MNTPATSPNATPTAHRRPLLRALLLALAAILLLLVVLGVVVAMQPSEFVVTRKMSMQAPPEEVFAQLNNFQNWNGWSPWAKLDPHAKNTFAGPEAGTGAEFHWDGNNEVGAGGMKIVESKPNELVKLKLSFLRPMESSCDTTFLLQPQGDQTEVTWSMAGENNFIGKAMCLAMDMDKLVGGQFEEGLTNIKAIVEK